MRLCQYIGVWFLFICTLSVFARNPGFKARITSKGLRYANDVAIQALKKHVQALRIPNQNGKASGFEYEIKNIHVTQFNPPASTIDINPGHGLTWRASNAYIAVKGDFRYKKWFFSGHGSFTARMLGVSFSLGMDIGVDTSGRPTIGARSCSSGISKVDFRFHGGLSWLYNLFRGKVGRLIKDNLDKQMCKLVRKEINEDGKKKLARLKVTLPLAKKFLLDYRLIQKPIFKTKYMEIFHKGEIYWLKEPSAESPLVAPAIPDLSDTGSMLYLSISDYMFDTFGYQAQKHGFLKYNLTQKNLPPQIRSLLNTTCGGFIPKCIGKFIPEIGEKYPNCVVDLHIKSTNAPTMKITSAGVNSSFAGVIDLFARKPGHPASTFLLTLIAKMSTTANVSIHNERMLAEIKDIQLKLKAGKSAVGKISTHFLDLISIALKVILIPQLNDIGSKGFPLPVTDEIKFQNTRVSFEKDTVLVSTDLKYEASSVDVVEDMTGPLKFKPSVHLGSESLK